MLGTVGKKELINSFIEYFSFIFLKFFFTEKPLCALFLSRNGIVLLLMWDADVRAEIFSSGKFFALIS